MKIRNVFLLSALAFLVLSPVATATTGFSSEPPAQNKLENLIGTAFGWGFGIKNFSPSTMICVVLDELNIRCAGVNGVQLFNGYLRIVLRVNDVADPNEIRAFVFVPEHAPRERWQVETKMGTKPMAGTPLLFIYN